MRPRGKTAVLILFAVAASSVGSGCAPRSESPSAAPGASGRTVRVGQEGTPGFVPAARSAGDLLAYLAAQKAYDSAGMSKLRDAGRVVLMDQGFRATRLPDPGANKAVCAVQLANGPLAGQRGFVPADFVQEER